MSATPVPPTPMAGQQPTFAEPSTADAYDGPSTISAAQYKFMLSTIRSIKKQKDAFPFLRPVDPVALNVPHYPTIIKHPMDISTVERKLNASNPAKPDPNLANPRYLTAEQFVADVRLMISNAETFNGPDHDVTKMGKRLEAFFDKGIKQLPPPDEARFGTMREVLAILTCVRHLASAPVCEGCNSYSSARAAQEGGASTTSLNVGSCYPPL
jgi:hypothetical protein